MGLSDFDKFLYGTRLSGFLDADRTSEGSIVFIDYCRVVDKYGAVASIAENIRPYHLVLLDGRVRSWTAAIENCSVIEPPHALHYREDAELSPIAHDVLAREPFSTYEDIYAQIEMEGRGAIRREIIVECVQTAFHFTNLILRIVRPKLVIVWNQFNPLSKAAIDAARQLDLPVAFAEFGLLPGTLNFDLMGQMGESIVARHTAEFASLPIQEEDRNKALKALDFFRVTGLNRVSQNTDTSFVDELKQRARARKILFLAGINDFSSGILPYDDIAARYHSPLFASSLEAAQSIAALAERRNWFLLYKPHPFCTRICTLPDSDHVFQIGRENINACIDAADVTLTILSQASYVSLIRGKPVVMLGHNQLSRSDAVYRPDDRPQIEPMIEAALSSGVTNSQMSAWTDHVARLLKYYLYRYQEDLPRDVAARPLAHLGTTIKDMVKNDRFEDDMARSVFGSGDSPVA